MAEFVDNFSDLIELGIDCEVNELDERFNKAADHLQTLVDRLDDTTLLTLYAYYKQGKEGVCRVAKPSWFDFKGRSKWEAWKKLENMSEKEAKSLYVVSVEKLDPSFDSSDGKIRGSWYCASTLAGGVGSLQEGKTILDFVKDNNRDEFLKLLDTSSDIEINQLDGSGMSLLHWASDRGSIEILNDLLSRGADVNIKDWDGQTALHYAASCGHSECVKFLLSKGALVTVADSEGYTAVDVCNDEDIKELLENSLTT